MKPEHWQQLDQLFHSALGRAPAERSAFLHDACEGDESLRKQVEALLSAHGEAGSFIESPAFEVEARSLADDQDVSAVGQTIGHYQILSSLGRGGMGEVYLAEDTKLRRKIALKLLPTAYTRDNDRVRRFQQEAQAASALNHPNIITIYEIGQVGERHFIAAEFIDGATLRQHFFGEGRQASGKPFRWREVLDIAIQTADALAAAHEAGIVHRDIKPENIMVRRRDGYVKVLDFGLAKLSEGPQVLIDSEDPTRAQVKTSAGVVMGTASYMSPEQARGEKVDARTDIWSLGVVIYEMVAGCVPFERTTPTEVIALILERDPVPLPRYARDVPAELERIVSKTLTKDREERYQTAKDLLVDLRRLKQRLEVEAEIERTTQPAKSTDEKAVITGKDQATAPRVAAVTGNAAITPTLGTVYPVKEIKTYMRGALIVAVALTVTIAAVVYFAYSHYVRENRAGTIHSFAVLPFENKTNDADLEYLSDGISESLINNLSQLPGVTVISRNSSFKYKGKDPDPQSVANELGVDAILTGRVLQRGDNLAFSVELVNARDKTQLWGEQYNRKATDLLQLQSEISQEIAQKLRLRLTGDKQQQQTRREGVNPRAYEVLLRARFYWAKADLESQKKAIDYYQQAIRIDPTYALAYAELAAGYITLYASGNLDPKEFAPKAELAVYKALELDEGLAEAHNALAGLKQNAWEWAAAEREYQRAIELNPNRPEIHHFYSFFLMVQGRYDEAIAEAKHARELDPLSLGRTAQVVNCLNVARRYDEAIDLSRKILEMDQNSPLGHGVLAFAYAGKGMFREAINEYLEAIKLGGDTPTDQIYLGAFYAKAGDRGKAQQILKRLQTTDEYVSPGELAVLYTALGERDQAFASLEKAYASHDLQLGNLRVDASFDSLREDPRFKDLMRRVGLTP